MLWTWPLASVRTSFVDRPEPTLIANLSSRPFVHWFGYFAPQVLCVDKVHTPEGQLCEREVKNFVEWGAANRPPFAGKLVGRAGPYQAGRGDHSGGSIAEGETKQIGRMKIKIDASAGSADPASAEGSLDEIQRK